MTSARDLTARLADLLSRERAALAEFLVELARFDEDRRWLELGYASLFDFLRRELGLSKGAAFYRKTAAALIQRLPEIVEPLRDGRLCLTSIVELSKVLTPENRDTVLPRFFHLSRTQAKEVAAELCPVIAPPRRDVVTAVRVAVPPSTLSTPDDAGNLALGSDALPSRAPSLDIGQAVHQVNRVTEINLPVMPAASGTPEEVDVPSPPARAPTLSVEPLTADLRRIHLTVSRAFLRKLEQARDALSHSHPGADAQAILETGLDLLLARHAKRRGKAERPRREPPPSRREHVPAHVRRAVWERDGGRCQWRLDSGEICGSTCRVQLDHLDPKGRGGEATVDRMRLLCVVHNQYYARLVYGDAWMDRFTRRARRPAPADAPSAGPPPPHPLAASGPPRPSV